LKGRGVSLHWLIRPLFLSSPIDAWRELIVPSSAGASKVKLHGMGDEYNDNPGPGAYCVKDAITHEQAPSYSLAAKLRSGGGEDDNPGPGTYSPRDPGKGPAYSLPGRLKGKAEDENPGPGTYSSQTRHTQSSPPAYTMASKLDDAGSSSENPGPGTYDPKLIPGGPSFSLRARSASEGADDNPGPGAYDPYVHNCIPAYSLAKRLDGNRRDESPGPGAYNVQQKRDSPAFTIAGRLDHKRPPGRNTR
jgi:rRNA maturation protein Nop10